MHSKCMAIDDDIAVIGSSNLDMRSFHLNMEVTLVVYDRDAVVQLRHIEAGYLKRSKRVRLDEWEQAFDTHSGWRRTSAASPRRLQ